MNFDITRTIQRITRAASADEGKPYLNAVCFRNGNAYATDGHTIAVAVPVAESPQMIIDETPYHHAESYVVPVWIIDKFDFTKKRPTICLECGEENAEAHYDKKNLSIPIVKEPEYPNVEAILPTDRPVKTVRMGVELLKVLHELGRGDTGCEWVDFEIHSGNMLGFSLSNGYRGMIALKTHGEDEPSEKKE